MTDFYTADLPSFIVMDVMRDAAKLEQQGRSIIHLEVGQPQSSAPRAAIKAIAEALGDPSAHGYTQALGLPVLRAAIAQHYAQFYQKTVPEDRIIVTLGSSLGFVMALLTACPRGARIALPSPGYPAYRNILDLLGMHHVTIPLRAEQGWRCTADDIRALPEKPDGLILASPMNPTGAMVAPTDMAEIATYCHDNNIRLISDEIYHGITFGKPSITAIDLSPSLIVVNSFSKFFSMTGHRIGWMIVPDNLVGPMERLNQNLLISVPTLGQIAAAATLNSADALAEVTNHVARYAANREILMSGLPSALLGDFPVPDGAFYIYADCRALGDDSRAVAHSLLHEAGVAVTPGSDFDPENGHLALRLSFAGSTSDMHEACTRLNDWVKKAKR